MTINLQIKRTCNHCGHVAKFSGNIQPDDLERMLWHFQLDNDSGCMAVDPRLSGWTFCSDRCLAATLVRMGLKPYEGPAVA